MANKRVQFKNRVDFDRQETDKFIFPFVDYDLKGPIPSGIVSIADPVKGEVYYFDDETNDRRPGLYLYVGKRGDEIYLEEADPVSGTYEVNLDLSTSDSSSINSMIGSGEDIYLHIHEGNNIGVYLIDDTEENKIKVLNSGDTFSSDSSSVVVSVRNTDVFEWIDIARPDNYLRMFEYQKLITEDNKIPFTNISGFALTSTQVNNLSDDKLASGAEPWATNAAILTDLIDRVDDIEDHVEIRTFAFQATNSMFSSNSITVTRALEEVDDHVLAKNRNNLFPNYEFDFSFYVKEEDFEEGYLQIGGNRNTNEGDLIHGVLYMSKWDGSGRYPFIRTDREAGTTGTEEEPDFSWYPEKTTGIFSKTNDEINFSINGKEAFQFIRSSSFTKFNIFDQDDLIFQTRITETNGGLAMFGERNFYISWDAGESSEVQFLEVVKSSSFIQSVSIYPFIKFDNVNEDDGTENYFYLDNFNGHPRMLLFDSLGDKMGGFLSDPNSPGTIDFFGKERINFLIGDPGEYIATIDTYDGVSSESLDLSTTGVELQVNQGNSQTIGGEDFRDWLRFSAANPDGEKIEEGDFIIVEESISGNIRRYFYDSEGDARYVQKIEEISGDLYVGLKTFTSGAPRVVEGSTFKRLVLNKTKIVPGSSRFLLTGFDEEGDTVSPGGIRIIPFEDISLFSKRGSESNIRDIYISPSEYDVFRFSYTRAETETGDGLILPFFEITDANRISLGYFAANQTGDLMMSGFGSRTYLFARSSYFVLHRDNPVLTTMELSGSDDENEGNFRVSLHGEYGNTEFHITEDFGRFRFRNAIAYRQETVDVEQSAHTLETTNKTVSEDPEEKPIKAPRPEFDAIPDPVEIYPVPKKITNPIKVVKDRSIDDSVKSRVTKQAERRVTSIQREERSS